MLIHDPIVRHFQRDAWSCVVAASAEVSDPVEPRVLLRAAQIAEDRACRLYRIRWADYAQRSWR